MMSRHVVMINCLRVVCVVHVCDFCELTTPETPAQTGPPMEPSGQSTLGLRDGMPAHCWAWAQSSAGGPRMAPPVTPAIGWGQSTAIGIRY